MPGYVGLYLCTDIDDLGQRVFIDGTLILGLIKVGLGLINVGLHFVEVFPELLVLGLQFDDILVGLPGADIGYLLIGRLLISLGRPGFFLPFQLPGGGVPLVHLVLHAFLQHDGVDRASLVLGQHVLHLGLADPGVAIAALDVHLHLVEGHITFLEHD